MECLFGSVSAVRRWPDGRAVDLAGAPATVRCAALPTAHEGPRAAFWDVPMMTEQEFDGALMFVFLGVGLALIGLAMLLERRWEQAAFTLLLVGLAMWGLAGLAGVASA